MAHSDDSDARRPKMEGINEFARFITAYGTPTVLAVIAFFLVSTAFGRGFAIGVRSLSAALLPIVVASFLFVFKKDLLQALGSVPMWLGVFLGAGMGIVVMIGVRQFGHGLPIPLAELLVSACFSVLVFSAASTEDERSLSLFYGTLLGMLLYVVLLGVPIAGAASG